MPELYSRVDETNWLTPSIADILEQGAAPPGGDGSIREHMLTIQRELADMETPAKIINVRSMPSYTLYVARPETVGRLGNRRTITTTEIRRSLARVAESHNDWLIGFIPKLREDESTVGILLRTNAHRPLSLRRLLVRNTFRAAKSYNAFTLGITLEQDLIVRDLNTIKHLLVVGADNAKTHFLRSALLTFVLLNTPSELRLILAGKDTEAFKPLVAIPHALGRLVTQKEAFQRILDGLQKEVARRKDVFNELQTDDLDAYNAHAREHKMPTLPRLLVVVDPITDPAFNTAESSVLKTIMGLLPTCASFGLHFIVTTNDLNALPKLNEQFKTQIVMRTAAKSLVDQVPDFHPSLLRFVDAFVVEHEQGKTVINPVELCSTSNGELINAVAYWQQMRQQRSSENPNETTISGRTGVTDLLPAVEVATPPAPSEKPAASKEQPLLRHTAILLDREPSTSDKQRTTEQFKATTGDMPSLFAQAKALAAYLGWLSVGALHDIFYLEEPEANALIAYLQREGILEDTDDPTPRFLKQSS